MVGPGDTKTAKARFKVAKRPKSQPWAMHLLEFLLRSSSSIFVGLSRFEMSESRLDAMDCNVRERQTDASTCRSRPLGRPAASFSSPKTRVGERRMDSTSVTPRPSASSSAKRDCMIASCTPI